MSLLNVLMLGNNKAEIRIYGVIGEGWFADVTSEDLNRELDALEDVTEIDVRINSPGGGVFAGAAIYNSLKRYKAKINIYIDGICASIATVVAMAGDTINMGRTAMMMIHNPYSPSISGDAKELRKKAEDLDKLKEISIGAYMTKVNLTREELIEKMDYETWMTADEAKDLGFITHIENDIDAQMCLENNILMCGKDIQIDISKFKNLNSFLEKEHIQKSKQNKKNIGEKNMNFEQFKQKYPDLFKQVIQMGITSERSRIENLEKIEQRAGRSLECVQKAKFETPIEPTNQELINDVLQEMSTQPPKGAITPKVQDKMEVLLNKIDDAKQSGVQEEVAEGMTGKELTEKQEADEIDEIVMLANGEE